MIPSSTFRFAAAFEAACLVELTLASRRRDDAADHAVERLVAHERCLCATGTRMPFAWIAIIMRTLT